MARGIIPKPQPIPQCQESVFIIYTVFNIIVFLNTNYRQFGDCKILSDAGIFHVAHYCHKRGS